MDDLVGKSFGRWSVISKGKNGDGKWKCKCECGNTRMIKGANLKSGVTKSCGCLAHELTGQRNTKHGQAKRSGHHPLYAVWSGLKSRCGNPNNPRYKCYGGRGITVCREWVDSFENFYEFATTNGWRKGLEIDRIDVNGNYEPQNVRFVTPRENSMNCQRTIYVEGICLSEYCKKNNISYSSAYKKYRRNKTKGAVENG